MPPQGRACAWWKVRPILQIILVGEALGVIALITMDATSAAIARAWFRVQLNFTMADIQFVLTALAIMSVIAVAIEGVRRARLSPRRTDEGLKVASA